MIISPKLKLKDSNLIIKVKPMRYEQENRIEFDKQIQESKSPQSSLAFMVRNHAEIKQGKLSRYGY